MPATAEAAGCDRDHEQARETAAPPDLSKAPTVINMAEQ